VTQPTDGTDRATTSDRDRATRAVAQSKLNGQPARVDDLRALALVSYGHFTSMQVVDGRVSGLDLHLARLESATRELFAQPLDIAKVRGYMRDALGGQSEAVSLRVNVFARDLNRDRLVAPTALDVLTTISAARQPGTTPVRLKSFSYARVLPHIKHVGTFELFHHRRLAQLAGFDDALFLDSSGALSEASVWNIGFFDGNGIVWPNAPALAGISMQLLQKGLRERGIATRERRIAHADIAQYRAAFLTNSSCAARAISSIDGFDLAADPALIALLQQCHAMSPPQHI
jgi:branched-subunit amino acid aminotransferase/4-amino-4-deoxychorismate lyase